VNGWLFRITFRPFVWIKRLSLLSVAGLIALSPCSLESVQALNISTQPVMLDTSAQAREQSIRKVYAELSPRMKDKLELVEIRKVSETIIDECAKLGVDYLFIIAIIEAESNFDIEAVSPTGARGLMQIMPGTFREVSNAKRMFDPAENVRAGIRYVAKLYSQGFTTPWDVLFAYNQGPGTVVAVWRKQITMPEEAQTYIPRVMNNYRTLLAKNGKSTKDTKKLFMVATR